MRALFTTLLVSVLSLTGILGQNTPFEVTSVTISDIPASQPVEVSCVFENAWIEATHPLDYPSGSAHWSPMVLASHSSAFEMWAPQQMASAGVQLVAEVRVW